MHEPIELAYMHAAAAAACMNRHGSQFTQASTHARMHAAAAAGVQPAVSFTFRETRACRHGHQVMVSGKVELAGYRKAVLSGKLDLELGNICR
jgi:hypothetical protein